MLPKEQQFTESEHAAVFLLTHMDNIFQAGKFFGIDTAPLRRFQFRHKFVCYRNVIGIPPAVCETQAHHIGLLQHIFKLVGFITCIYRNKNGANPRAGEKHRVPVRHICSPYSDMIALPDAY